MHMPKSAAVRKTQTRCQRYLAGGGGGGGGSGGGSASSSSAVIGSFEGIARGVTRVYSPEVC